MRDGRASLSLLSLDIGSNRGVLDDFSWPWNRA